MKPKVITVLFVLLAAASTMAALMGTLPIAIGFGAGSESRRPLGLAVVGGLLFSQTVTLFVTPVFYLYMEKLRRHKTGSAFVPALATPLTQEFAITGDA